MSQLVRPSRQGHARRNAATEADSKSKKARVDKDETVRVVTTEFNYNYRIGGTCWINYKEAGDSQPKETPVLIIDMLLPPLRPDIVEINALYLYSTRYLVDMQQDYNQLLPEGAIGNNVYVLANRPLSVASSCPSSAWTATAADIHEGQA